MARELADDGNEPQSSRGGESSSSSSSSSGEAQALESGAMRTPQREELWQREPPGAPRKAVGRERRYTDDGASPRARRRLFEAERLAQGYVVLQAIALLCVAFALSALQPAAHLALPDEFGGITASRCAATLLVCVAVGLITSTGPPLAE